MTALMEQTQEQKETMIKAMKRELELERKRR